MTDGGEGGSAASNSWRHRWLAGPLFVPVGLGGLSPAVLSLAEIHRLELRLHRFAGSLTTFDRVTVAVIVAIWLGAAVAARRSHGAAVAGALGESHRSRVPSPAVGASGSPGRPGPGVELLALFARPAAQPMAPAGAAEHGIEPAAVPDEAPTPERMIRLFGPLVVDGSDGRGLGQRATRGLLAFLVLQRGGADAEEILTALWPDDPLETARPRLWNATRHVRALLGAGLRRSGSRYALDPAAVSVDAWELERLAAPGAAQAALERALVLGFADPLVDVDYPWVEGERRRLQAVRFDLLARVGTARLEAGDPRGALSSAEELLAHDPLNERGWRLAMEAEGMLGARSAIIERYQSLSGELDRQLGLRPQPETRSTFRRLLGQS